ncbi:MAG: DUF4296 domain-containing protein [Proteobacteria bacterium]|nr:MAG: DUF4296 domain-containing protein [Pseudomonadota bacterium]
MKKYFCIAILFTIWACGETIVEKPDNLIDEDTMVDILYDLSLIDAMKSHNPGALQTAKEPTKYIYKKYKIDSLQFANSNRYYATNLRRYKKLYKRVGMHLERTRAAIDSSSAVKKSEPLPEGGMIK